MSPLVGASLKRKEDRRLLTGAGRYVDDIAPPGAAHLALVRSPHAHARLTRIDTARARKLPGVLAVLTVKDVPELGAEVPRADQIPPIDLVHVAFPSAVNELGIKGVGESGVIAPGAVVANAVEDALSDYGVRIDRLPVTPRRVFEALRAASADFPRLVR